MARTSRTEAELAARLQDLPEGSARAQAVQAAQGFKASWVALGEALVSVREKRAYVGWGFPTFEAYCRRELHVKRETANKLTRSFAFLRDHAPATLGHSSATGDGDGDNVHDGGRGRAPRAAPPLDVVDLLSQAPSRTKISAEAVARASEQLLAQPVAPTREDVLKRLREDDPDAYRPAPRAVPLERSAVALPVELRKALLLAERLEGLLEAQGDAISAAGKQRARALAEELRQTFRAAQASAAAQDETNEGAGHDGPRAPAGQAGRQAPGASASAGAAAQKRASQVGPDLVPRGQMH
jgi:hypothetical protein